MLFETPLVFLIVASVLHLGFRLTYFLHIGRIVRREGRVFPKPPGYEERWWKFKKKAEFVLNMDAITFAAVIVLSHGTLQSDLGYAVVIPIGAVLCVIGIGVKVAAAKVIGVRGYYWYNTFCPKEECHYSKKGIYKYLDNPMYGVGYLHMFGFALAALSVWGLCFALFDWGIVWAMNLLFERPHTKRVVARSAKTRTRATAS